MSTDRCKDVLELVEDRNKVLHICSVTFRFYRRSERSAIVLSPALSSREKELGSWVFWSLV